MTKSITFIGCGNMAQAMICGITAAKEKYQITVIENDKKKAKLIQKNLSVKIIEDFSELEPDLIILSVKPKDIKSACQLINVKKTTIVSIAAGIKLNTIQSFLNGQKKLARVMPNLCAFEGLSTNAIFFNKHVSKESKKIINKIFSSIGTNILLNSEKLIDSATAISGSGPAYIFYFLMAMIEAAKNLGIPKKESQQLAYNTFLGSCNVAKKNLDNLDNLIKNVSSKGGTTEAALKIFNNDGFEKIIKKAVNQAATRAQELDKELKSRS
jgi:pyrroline-5-carboxylate reductase